MPGPEDRHEPLDLGTLTPTPDDDGAGAGTSAPPEPGRSLSPWRLRATIGVALAAGVAIGIVASNARDEAAQAQQVELVAGALQSWGAQRHGVELTLMNAGPHAVDIVDVTLPGWGREPGADDPDVITAEPGAWVTFDVRAEPGCDADRSGNVTVTARSESGDRTTTTLSLLDQHERALEFIWQEKCGTLRGAGVEIHNPSAVSSESDTATVTVPVANGVDRPQHITAVASETPGFVVGSPDLPLVLSATESGSMRITWTLDDCAAAQDVEAAVATIDLVAEDLQRRVSHTFSTAVLIELVRVTERSCRT